MSVWPNIIILVYIAQYPHLDLAVSVIPQLGHMRPRLHDILSSPLLHEHRIFSSSSANAIGLPAKFEPREIRPNPIQPLLPFALSFSFG